MNKSMKFYKKAILSYQLGKIDEAIEICEKSISISMKNSSAINLKGLLYYLKGDLEAARSMWRLNTEINRDEVSKKYLKDCKDDDMKGPLYAAAIQAVNELNIREAIGLLLECSKSDYNCINVYNALTSCYIKVGEYNKAIESIDKVLAVDKNNKIAVDNKNTLITLGVIKRKFDNKMFVSFAAVICIFLIIGCSIYLGINKSKESSSKASEKKLAEKQQVKEEQSIKEKETKVNEPEKKEAALEPFPYEQVNKYINDRNFEELYTIKEKWQNQNLNVNEKTLMSKVNDLLKGEGTGHFYKKGMESFNKKDYNASAQYLYKGVVVGEENDLYSEIIYMLAVSLENTGDIEKAITYYEMYTTKFPQGNYEPIALYRLALIYKPLDINKAKAYSKRIVDFYPKTIYNNSNIKDILNK